MADGSAFRLPPVKVEDMDELDKFLKVPRVEPPVGANPEVHKWHIMGMMYDKNGLPVNASGRPRILTIHEVKRIQDFTEAPTNPASYPKQTKRWKAEAKKARKRQKVRGTRKVNMDEMFRLERERQLRQAEYL